MNLFASPRITAFVVSSALFCVQLVAFGTSTNHAVATSDCPEVTVPSAITEPPVAPEGPRSHFGLSQTSPVSI